MENIAQTKRIEIWYDTTDDIPMYSVGLRVEDNLLPLGACEDYSDAQITARDAGRAYRVPAYHRSQDDKLTPLHDE